MRKILLPCFILSLALAAFSCGSQYNSSGSAAGDDVAAAVNGSKIMVKDVDRLIAQKFGGQENQLSQIEIAAYRLQALDTLINQEALYQEAQKQKMDLSDDDLKKAIQSYKFENGHTEESFVNELKQINLTENQFRDNEKKRLAIEKLYGDASSKLNVQDREVADLYKANPKRYSIQPGITLSDIIIDPSDNGAKFDVKGDTAAEQRAREIKARLIKGADFATIARQYSEHQSALRAGDLGTLAKAQFPDLPQIMGLPASVGEKLYTMEVGDVTEPIKDSAGRWHIFKVTGKQTETRDRNLDEVRAEITAEIRTQRKQVIDAAIQARARDEARTENYLARRMLENPNSFGVLRPIPTGSAGSTPTPEPTQPSDSKPKKQ